MLILSSILIVGVISIFIGGVLVIPPPSYIIGIKAYNDTSSKEKRHLSKVRPLT